MLSIDIHLSVDISYGLGCMIGSDMLPYSSHDKPISSVMKLRHWQLVIEPIVQLPLALLG